MVEEFEVESYQSNQRPQYYASVAASLGAFAIGNVVSWTSPTLPQIEKSGEFGDLSTDEKSWIGSIVPLAAVIAGPIAGYSVDRFGRRKTMMILSIPMTLGWAIIAFSQNLVMLNMGRFLTGFCIGGLSLAIPVFIAEITEEGVRGAMSTNFPIFAGVGILCTYILGIFLSWFVLTLVYMCLPVIFFACMFLVPESPVFLLSKGRNKRAALAMKWFRGAPNVDVIEPELHKMRRGIEEKRDQRVTTKEFFSPGVFKPTVITLFLMLFQQLSGLNAIIFYSNKIFESAGTNIDPNLSSIIIGVVLTVSVCFSTPLIDRAGRKILLIISAAGMTVSLVALGTYFYLKENNEGNAPEGLSWLPLASLMLFMVTFNIGYGPCPWILMSELIPTHIKGFSSALAVCFNWFCAFLVTKSFEDFTILLGVSGCFWMFALVCAVGTAFSFCFVPETKGKTLDEIQRSFRSS